MAYRSQQAAILAGADIAKAKGHSLGPMTGSLARPRNRWAICINCGAMLMVEQGVGRRVMDFTLSGTTQRMTCRSVVRKKKRATELRAERKGQP